MELKKLESAIVSVLFACGEPVRIDRLAETLETDKATLTKVIANLRDRISSENLGIVLLKLGDDYQLTTSPENAEFVKTALDRRRNAPLSAAAMEVLSIIAYNQPVTKAFIEQVRGVDSSSVVNSLVEKGLCEEAGRLDLPGKPICYKTTPNFLRCFNMESISELPSIETLRKDKEEADKALGEFPYEDEEDE